MATEIERASFEQSSSPAPMRMTTSEASEMELDLVAPKPVIGGDDTMQIVERGTRS